MPTAPRARLLTSPDRIAEAALHLRTSIIQPVLDIVGDRWTLAILARLFQGERRFDVLQAGLGTARSTLSGRLDDLVHHGLVERRRYQAHPPRDEYLLTASGRDTSQIMLLLQRWDATWGAGEDADGGMPRLRHHCAAPLKPYMICGACKQPVRARDILYEAGPGLMASGLPSRQRRPRRRSGPAGGNNGTPLSATDILGDRWMALVLATSYFGLRRFNDMQAALGIAPNILSRRLAELTQWGVFARHVYSERPRRAQYILTEKGLDLYPVTLSLMAWGDRWMAPPEGRPLILTHRECGNILSPKLACSACNEIIETEAIGA